MTSRVNYSEYENALKEYCKPETLEHFGDLTERSRKKVLDNEIKGLLDDVERLRKDITERQKKRTKRISEIKRAKKIENTVTQKLNRVVTTAAKLRKPQILEPSFEVVKFNVGGQIIFVSIETLEKEPSSLLYALATNQVECTRDDDGNMFIDRNPKYFGAVIEYLRSGWYDKERGDSYLDSLYKEALYLGVSSLVTELEGIEIDSALGLSFIERKALTEWCDADDFTLLYRASRDGFASKNFHECCDGVADTLTIVKTVTGYIFGGYTGVCWESPERHDLVKGSGREFLFTLRNPQNTGPIQFPVRCFDKYRSVLRYKDYGPSFGANSKGHCEAHIAENPDKNINSHVLGFPSMYDGKGYTNSIFCGSDRFQVEDYEVFLVTKKGLLQRN